MFNIPSSFQALIICGLLILVWKIFRHLVISSPLDNIPGPPCRSWIGGHYGQMFERQAWTFHRELGENYGPVVKIRGPFGDTQLFTFDPLAVHHILVKDQHIFEETSEFFVANRLVLGIGLLSTNGEHHRRQRKLLNPAFSTNNLRDMLPLFYRVAYSLRQAIASSLQDGPREIDALSWFSRTSLELVGQGGIGHSFDPLVEEKSNPYGEAMKSLIPTACPMFILQMMLPFLDRIRSPRLLRRLLEVTPYPRLQRVREIVDLMDCKSQEIFQEKKLALERGDEALTQQVGEGKDIMSRLLRANMATSEEDKLPDHELLGQISTFIFAGTDTTSTALAHTFHLLAEHPAVQEKLQREIRDARARHGDIPFDALMELPYLDAVCRETLRLYPPVSFVIRSVRQDVVLPLSAPVRGIDGRMMHDVPLAKNSKVVIGMLASNRNPALWGEDSYEWKPERWLSPLPKALTDARIPGIYSNLLTFIGGGRACIGFKFSELEMKVVLTVLLECLTFSLSDKAVVWNHASVQYPTVGWTSTKAELPLVVAFSGKLHVG